jgi:hypothetical protein
VKKALNLDLIDLGDILESFVNKLEKMAPADLIDLAARIKPAAKHIKAIDEYVKEFVKAERKGVEGDVLGTTFKATLNIVPTTRLDQKALQENKPTVYAQFLKSDPVERITFSVR